MPRNMVEALSLEMFKVRLDVALGILIQLEVNLLTAGGLNKMTLEGPFQSVNQPVNFPVHNC